MASSASRKSTTARHVAVLLVAVLLLVLVTLASSKDFKESWSDLKHHFASRGAIINEFIGPRDFTGLGVGLEALRAIPKNTLLFRIPRHLLLHSDYIKKHAPKFTNLEKFLSAADSTIVSTWLAYLMQSKKMDGDALFKPYADALPRECTYGLSFSNFGSRLLPKKIWRRIKDWRSFLKAEWDVVSSSDLFSDIDPSLQLDFSFFEKAYCMRKTRSFLFSLDDDSVFMAPLADWVNHHTSPNVRYLFNQTNDAFEMYSKSRIDKGQQIFSNYGALSNEMLFLNFGFVLPPGANDFDEIDFKLPFPDPLSDPNLSMKYNIISKIKTKSRDSFQLGVSGFSELDMSIIRILKLQDFEFSAYNVTRALTSSLGGLSKIVSTDNEMSMVQVLADACMGYAEELKKLPRTQDGAAEWEIALAREFIKGQTELVSMCIIGLFG